MAECGPLQFTDAHLACALLPFRIPGAVFWPYFAGAVSLAIGLPLILRKEVPQAHGLDKLLAFGRLFYAFPLAVFGADHFVFAKGIAEIVPSWIPGHMFWVYFVGTALFAASLSFVLKRHSELAATLTGIMLFSFVALMHIPNIVADPGSRVPWIIALRDLSFSGGAFAFAGAQRNARSARGGPYLVGLARFFIGIPALVFGLEHFLHPTYVPAIPLDRVTPVWIPGRMFWAYFTGAVLLAAGVCILVNRKAHLAATVLGIVVFLVVLFVYLPINAASLSNIDNGLNYFADTLLYCGAVLLLADSIPAEGPSHA